MPHAPQIAPQIARPMAPRRLLVLAALGTSGLLAAATAFTVIVASTAQRSPIRLAPQLSASAAATRTEQPLLAPGDLADPTGSRVATVIGNVALPADYRQSLARTYAERGSCLRVREVLFGPGAERWKALDRVDAALHDLPDHAAAAAHRRTLLRKFETGLADGSLHSPALDFVLEAVVPSAARARIYYCRASV